MVSTIEGERDKALHSLMGMNKYMDTIVHARRISDSDDGGCCVRRAGANLVDAAEVTQFATMLLRAGREPAVVESEWGVTWF